MSNLISDIRVYPGRLSFLPVEPYVPPTDINSTYRRTLVRSQSEYQYPTTRTEHRLPRSQSVCEVEQILREKAEALRMEEDINENHNFQANGNTPVDSTEEELERVTFTAGVSGMDDKASGESSIHHSNHHVANGTIPPVENSSTSNTRYANGDVDSRQHQVPTPL